MERTFNLFNQLPDIVVVEPRSQTQGARFDLEWGSRISFGAAAQSQAEAVVHGLFKGLSGAPGLLPQLGTDIVVES